MHRKTTEETHFTKEYGHTTNVTKYSRMSNITTFVCILLTLFTNSWECAHVPTRFCGVKPSTVLEFTKASLLKMDVAVSFCQVTRLYGGPQISHVQLNV
jgi:hypothetical protein